MADKFTREKRSSIMSRVKGRDTRPEKIVRSLLHGMGYRFRLNRKDLPGKPDIVLPKYRKIIFVHGCFWHGHPGCRRAGRPAANADFWNSKLDGNAQRDMRVLSELYALHWQVLIVWECQSRNLIGLQKRLLDFMNNEGNITINE